MRIVYAFMICMSLLFSRDNPFAEVVGEGEFPISTNMPKILGKLKNESFTLPSTARSVKRIIVEYQNLDGSIGKSVKELDKSVDWHMPINIRHKHAPEQSKQYQSRANLKFIDFATKNSEMKISTTNRMLRHFMLANPHRVVIDFERNSKFLSKKFTDFSRPFKAVRIGNHDGYYRVVVELDGQYEYQIKSYKNSYVIKIR